MDETEKNILIQKYIQGNLSEQEKIVFDNLLANDIEFNNSVSQHKNVGKAIFSVEHDDLKNRLNALESSKQSFNLRKYISVALIFVLVGFGSHYFYEHNKNKDNYFVNYFEPYPNALQPITRNNSEMTTLTHAVLAYENGEYSLALHAFNSILEEEKDNDILFYKSMSLLNLGQTDKALDILSNLETLDTRFIPQVYWYNSLIYLKYDNSVKAKENLLKLLQLKTPYKQNEAKEILQKMKD